MQNKIHLTIIQPMGYVHSQGFIDQARYARYQFRRLGMEVTIGKNRLREDAINLVFGAHLGFPAEIKERYTCIFINLEQLGMEGAKLNNEYLNILSTSAVIDYDERNLEAYGCKPNSVPIVSFLNAPYLKKDGIIPIEKREIDLLFYGSINERRIKLLQRIESCGWNVSRFDRPLYTEERDEYIRNAKAILNIHFYEASRFEQTRVFHSLSLGTPVISERNGKTNPPKDYEETITWLNDQEIESFFEKEFMSQEWLKSVKKQIELFEKSENIDHWKIAGDYIINVERIINKGKKWKAWEPKVINIGSGKDYKLGWLNIDVNKGAQPDIILDISKKIEFPIEMLTQRGGVVRVRKQSIKYIYANNVLEHIGDLTLFMSNILELLEVNGILEVEVPFEKSKTAWQDPTYVRAINQNLWIYFTEWFWYLGWFDYRFELTNFKWIDLELNETNEANAAFMKVILRKVKTSPHEKSVARTMDPGFINIPED